MLRIKNNILLPLSNIIYLCLIIVYAESPPRDTERQSLAMFDEQNDGDVNMDDVITEAPRSPQELSPPLTPAISGGDDGDDNDNDHQQPMDVENGMIVPNTHCHESNVANREPITPVKIKRISIDQSFVIEKNSGPPKAPVNAAKESHTSSNERNSKSKKTSSKELKNLQFEGVNKAGRVIQRRLTMATHISECALPNTSGRKRRLSYSSKKINDVVCIDAPNGNDVRSSTTKRMRLESDAVAAPATNTQKRTNATKPVIPAHMNSRSSLISNVAVDVTATATVCLSPSPQLNKSSKRRNKSTNATATPLITKFFTHKTSTPIQSTSVAIPSHPSSSSSSLSSPLMCNKCSKILTSRNELNFHLKCHELKCCVKCKKAIDTANPISTHVISCLYMGNSVPNENLNRFLKVKVDLNRLTPNKIKQIQKNLQCKDAALSRGDISTNRDNQKEATENADCRSSSNAGSRRDSTASITENAQNSINEKLVNGKNDHGKFVFNKNRKKLS